MKNIEKRYFVSIQGLKNNIEIDHKNYIDALHSVKSGFAGVTIKDINKPDYVYKVSQNKINFMVEKPSDFDTIKTNF